MKILTILLSAALLCMACNLTAQEPTPRKNYVTAQAGLWPTDKSVYVNGEMTDSYRYSLCAEANIQTIFESDGMYRRRTVNYTINFGYKF